MGIHLDISKSKFHTTLDIAHCVYRQDGFKGFYRGYVASVCTYAPNSALWWSFYTIFQGILYTLNHFKQGYKEFESTYSLFQCF